MTRREGLLALGLMFALVAGGVTWLFGPLGLILIGLIGFAAVVFGFERVDPPRGEDVEGTVPREVLDALERGFSV